MTDRELLDEVRRLRAAGVTPKGIARRLGVRPAMVAPLVRELAAEATAPDQGALVGCWISPGWRRELLVPERDGWEDVELGADGTAGVAQVLVARAGRRDDVLVCGYLVDTFCLGVKDTYGPERMRRRELRDFVRTYFAVFPAPGVAAPLDLAQHVVHGAVAFAAGLGFEPYPGFAQVRGQLGELSEPSAITFGQEGKPLYIPGLRDDPMAILRTLKANVGSGNFAVAA
jgi:hypothetical protein